MSSRPPSYHAHSRQSSNPYGSRLLPHINGDPYTDSRNSLTFSYDPYAVAQKVYPSNNSIPNISMGNGLSRPSFNNHPLSPLGYEMEKTPSTVNWNKPPPAVGDIRQFHIEKTNEQLGIKIQEIHIQGELAGIFISNVTKNSLANKVGLQVGDQLLEVCGINLRTAKYTQAAQVLHRTGKSIDIKVQYNRDKFDMGENSTSAESLYGYGKDYSPSVPIFKSTPKRPEAQSNFHDIRQYFEESKSKSSTLKSGFKQGILYL